jgi:Tol biopolymer transport system component
MKNNRLKESQNKFYFLIFLLLFFTVYSSNLSTAERHSPLLHTTSFKSLSVDSYISVIEQKKILSGEFFSPQFTADGKKIILTGEHYKGLWCVNIDGSELQKITDEYLAGWRPVSSTFSEIIFRSREIEGDKIKYSIKKYDLKTKKTVELYHGIDEDIYPPKLNKYQDHIMFVKDRKFSVIKLRNIKGVVPIYQQDEKLVFSDMGKVWCIKYTDVQPLEISKGRETCGGEVLSPDGNKVAYIHGNTNSIIIYDLQKNNEIDIGEGSEPIWSPDGKFLAYIVTCDDGHRIIHSDIFVVKTDGTGKQRLTYTEDIAEVNPSWSPDGKLIVCKDALSDNIYLLKLRLK